MNESREQAAISRAAAGVTGVVAALQSERAGYVQRGLPNRVAQVDEQLAAYGLAVTESDGKQPAVTESDGEQPAVTESDGEQPAVEGKPPRGSARSRVPAPSDSETE